MEREFEKQNKEAIKLTMLMQERAFKHQVKELHRVHGVQKTLMEEVQRETTQSPDQDNLVTTQPAAVEGDEANPIPVEPIPASTEIGSSSSNVAPLATASNIEIEKHASLEDLSSPISAIENQLDLGSVEIGNRSNEVDADVKREIDLTVSVGCEDDSGDRDKSP